ncbi:hypothetical protein D9M72_500990 [compost metagenome]
MATRCRPSRWWRTPKPSAPSCGWWGAITISTPPRARSASNGTGAAAGASLTAWATRRCAGPTSCSTRRRRWPRCRPCASACRSAHRKCATGWPLSNCRDASRCCRAARPSSWTWRTIRMRRPRWGKTWRTWGSSATPMRCSARCRTRTSPGCCSTWPTRSTTGACATCRPSAPPVPRTCWPSWRRADSAPGRTPPRPAFPAPRRHSAMPSSEPPRMIEFWSSDRSIPSPA